MKRFGFAAAVTVASAGLVFGGCSSITNTGGDTTCKEFSGQDDQKRNSEVAKMLKDKRGEEASNLEVSAMRVAVDTYCKTLGKESSKIREAMP